MTIDEWRYDNVLLAGTSWAGMANCLVWPELGLSLDVAQGLPISIQRPLHLITHGHMDHASGIPYLISQRALSGLPPATFFMPQALVGPLTEIMRLWQQIEGHQYAPNFIGVEMGREYDIKPGYTFQAFQTRHRIPSNGYTIFQHRKHLRPEFAGLAPGEISRLRHQGVDVDAVTRSPLLSYTGDTLIEFLDGEEFVRKSRVLVMEVTFIDESKTVNAAREWGHIHLDELLPRLKDLACEKILLMHLSARHRPADLEQILSRRLPEEWRGRIDVFPRKFWAPKLTSL